MLAGVTQRQVEPAELVVVHTVQVTGCLDRPLVVDDGLGRGVRTVGARGGDARVPVRPVVVARLGEVQREHRRLGVVARPEGLVRLARLAVEPGP